MHLTSASIHIFSLAASFSENPLRELIMRMAELRADATRETIIILSD